MKNYQHLGLIGSVAFVSLITQPLQAANTQIIDIQAEKREHSLELKLDTIGTQKTIPKIITYNQGKTLVATLPNLKLGLHQNFTQKNPYPGISKIEINQGTNNNLNVKVTGEKQAPTGSIFLQQQEDLILGFTPQTPKLLAQAINNDTSSNNDVLVPNPQITIDGQTPITSGDAPAFLPRAVAPPVGDIAVSNIDSSPLILDVGKNIPVRRLVLKDAPVREVLALLARSAGVNLIFTNDSGDDKEAKDQKEATISLDIDNEPMQEVFNSVLLVADLQANIKGNTIFVGKNLPQQARNLVTRTFRLNQVKAIEAAGFLISQGASTQKVTTKTTTTINEVGDGLRQTSSETTSTIEPLVVSEEDAKKNNTTLLLKGVTVTSDDRLNSLTVIAEPRQMEMITSMIVQLDARRRQVAVNVKVVDVNLLNTEDFNSSLSFGVGDGFFVSDNGAAAFNYGGINPPSSDQVSGNLLNGQPIVANPLLNIGGNEGDIFFDPQTGPFSDINKAIGVPYAPRPGFGTNNNPFQPGITEIDDAGKFTYALPSFFQYPSKFLALLQAKVQSGNGKILTDPTLMVQEGQAAKIQLTQEVFGGFTKKQIVNPDGSSSIVDEPIIKNAGLILDLAVDRIDDNGFVSVNISPTISGISGSQNTAQGVITLTQERSVKSGTIRLRDGQTLILSGVIQESDRTTVSKVPILGDIPILGALFRSTNRQNSRNEVVILVTPQIIDDSDQSGWGYNYAPGQATRDLLKKQGMTVPGGS